MLTISLVLIGMALGAALTIFVGGILQSRQQAAMVLNATSKLSDFLPAGGTGVKR